MTGRVRVGCSGWIHPDWRGIVYPNDAPTKSWYSLYARRFDVVEINNTFYVLALEERLDHAPRSSSLPGECATAKRPAG